MQTVQGAVARGLRPLRALACGVGLAGALGMAGCAVDRAPEAQAAEEAVPLFGDLGDHHYAISTGVPEAQRYFDQGMRLTYAFNHMEAIRAYREAARLDPECAICHWGEALALGPNINAPMDAEAGLAAYAALERAWELESNASPKERALIGALSARYAADPPEDRAALDSAYAQAMARVAAEYPDDLDIATLRAEAMMNLRPWDYWMPDGRPYAGTDVIVATLERVVELNPNHPGACHYYIHAVEAVAPEKAVPCAERLARLMPGAGHMVHMPAHIYIRVGRWQDAIESNVHAIHADEEYITREGPVGIYPMGYYPHNIHFLSFAATMAGQAERAISAARELRGKIDMDVARAFPELVQPMVPYAHLVLVSFGRWDEVLAEPQPPEDMTYATGLVQYARGVAHAAKGHGDEAEAALQRLKAVREPWGDELPGIVLEIAAHALEGEIAKRSGDLDGAIAHFGAAARIEDGLLYMEPPHWYYPIRHSLGAALLEAGRAADAEQAYRQDLNRFPENGWSLVGLAQSLRAQGKERAAAEVDERLRRAWSEADLTLAASRL